MPREAHAYKFGISIALGLEQPGPGVARGRCIGPRSTPLLLFSKPVPFSDIFLSFAEAAASAAAQLPRRADPVQRDGPPGGAVRAQGRGRARGAAALGPLGQVPVGHQDMQVSILFLCVFRKCLVRWGGGGHGQI